MILKECPDAQLWLVGSYPPIDINGMANAQIHVTGSVSEAELIQHYQQARVVVALLVMERESMEKLLSRCALVFLV